MAAMRSSLDRAAALMLLLLCSAGVNARMLQQAATPTPPAPTSSAAESYACNAGPGRSAEGWIEIKDPQSDAGVDAAVNYVLQSLRLENEEYTVDFACSQFVAGSMPGPTLDVVWAKTWPNFYLVVSVGNGDKFIATVFKQLPAGNGGDGSYQITAISTSPGGARPNGTPAIGGDDWACPAGTGNSAGGWSRIEDPMQDADAIAAVEYVLQSLGQEKEPGYGLNFACSQVVAGTNFYLVVSIGNGSEFVATVSQQPPTGNGGDGSFQITSIDLDY